MTEPQYVSNSRYLDAARRINDQFERVQAQIDDINARRRIALQEMEKNIRAAFIAGREAVEAEIVATDRLTRERERLVDARLVQLRDDLTVLQQAVAAQVGPGRLSQLEEDVTEIKKYNTEHSAEWRQRRFSVYIAVLTGVISLAVALAATGVLHLLTSNAPARVPAHAHVPAPTVFETCVSTPHGVQCFSQTARPSTSASTSPITRP
jgi:hypothetical protein